MGEQCGPERYEVWGNSVDQRGMRYGGADAFSTLSHKREICCGHNAKLHS